MPLVGIEGIGKLITLQIEVTIEDYILAEWCEQQGVNDDDLDGQALSEFIDDHLGIWCDDVRML